MTFVCLDPYPSLLLTQRFHRGTQFVESSLWRTCSWNPTMREGGTTVAYKPVLLDEGSAAT
jgi:hypothetical protein